VAVKKVPTKAAPVKRTTAKVEPEEDLLAGLGEPAAVEDDEEFDLLDGISEDLGDPWTPHLDEDIPEGIQGKVISRTVIYADQDYGGGAIPLLEIEETSGHVWSVRGYHTVLRNQIEKNDPLVGDTVAIKYLGVKENKGGKDYQNYGMLCPKCNARK
jgi:hypothetical protein